MTFQGDVQKLEKKEKWWRKRIKKSIIKNWKVKEEKKGESQNNLSGEGNSIEKNEMENEGIVKNNGNYLCNGDKY